MVIHRPSVFLYRIACILLVFSSVFFAKLGNSNDSTDWCPVLSPLPGKDLETTEPFHISRGGGFQIQIFSPAKLQNTALNQSLTPAIPCSLLIDVECKGHLVTRSNINSLEYIGGSPFGYIKIYSGGDLTIKEAGDYVLKCKNLNELGPFAITGAELRMIRIGNAADWIIKNLFLRMFGWVLLIAGIVFCVICEVVNYKRSKRT